MLQGVSRHLTRFAIRSGTVVSTAAALGTAVSVRLSSTEFPKPLPEAEALLAWGRVDAVCFDVDSTVIGEEGIDEMADFFGKKEEVAALTLKAMEGGMPFHEALHLRLEAMQPTRDGLKEFMKGSAINLTPGVKELFATLHAKGVTTYLVSGGFREVIEPIAELVGVKKDHIYANRIKFNEDGSYKCFDADEPTSRAGGKAKVVAMLKTDNGHKTLAMVGDGATDLEARPPADLFVGFGGVMERPVVRDNADIFVRSFDKLVSALEE